MRAQVYEVLYNFEQQSFYQLSTLASAFIGGRYILVPSQLVIDFETLKIIALTSFCLDNVNIWLNIDLIFWLSLLRACLPTYLHA